MQKVVTHITIAENKTLLVAALMAMMFWIMESAVHVFIFKDVGFIEQIFHPEIHEAWMRFTVVCMFLGLGKYSGAIIAAWQRAEKTTLAAHAELQQIFETSADGMRVVKPDYTIAKANQTFADLCGVAKSELIGGKCYEIFSGRECHSPNCPMVQVFAGAERIEFDTIKVTKTGKEIPCIVTATPFRSHDGSLIGIVEDFKDITERRAAEKQLEHYSNRLHELTKHLQSSRESECQRIARVIHDELGQMLIVFKMDLHWILNRLPEESSELTAKVAAMKESVDATMRIIHTIVSELRPNLLDHLGLPAAIEWQLTEFEKRTAIRFSFEYEPDDLHVDTSRAIELFRILQEALTNVARHAQATNVAVALRQLDDQLIFSIHDNGVGIREAEQSNPKSFGLIGMRERAYSVNAHLSITGEPGEGTLVQVRMPIKEGTRIHD